MHDGKDVTSEVATFIRDLAVTLETNSPLSEEQRAVACLIEDARTMVTALRGAETWEQRARAAIDWHRSQFAFFHTVGDLAVLKLK